MAGRYVCEPSTRQSGRVSTTTFAGTRRRADVSTGVRRARTRRSRELLTRSRRRKRARPRAAAPPRRERVSPWTAWATTAPFAAGWASSGDTPATRSRIQARLIRRPRTVAVEMLEHAATAAWSSGTVAADRASRAATTGNDTQGREGVDAGDGGFRRLDSEDQIAPHGAAREHARGVGERVEVALAPDVPHASDAVSDRAARGRRSRG